MKAAVLKQRQKAMLHRLAGYVQKGQLGQPFVPIPFGNPTEFVLHVRGEASFRFKRISDLDALCDAGLLSFTWSRHGTGKLYRITPAGFSFVDKGTQPPAPLAEDVDLLELVQMMGGAAAAGELRSDSGLSQIARDPIERHTQVRALVEKARAAARSQLSWEAFVEYERQTLALEQALLYARPDGEQIRRLVRRLAFPETADLALALAVLPYLYPLLLIGAARLNQEDDR